MKIKTRVVLKEHTGAMIVYMLPKGFKDALSVSRTSFAPGSKFVPRAEYHITLAYMGDAAQIERDGELPQVREIINSVAAATAPFWIYIGGIGRFSNVEDGKYDAVYAKVRSHGLTQLHKQLADKLNAVSAKWKWDYQGYVPHVTLAYVPPGSKDTAEVTETEILAYRIALVLAGKAEYFALKGAQKTQTKQVLIINQV